MTHLSSILAAGLFLGGACLATGTAWGGEFTVRAEAVTEMKAVFGQVASRVIVPARARISGTITEIGVTEGAEVRLGDVVATVVDVKIALQLQAADAKIAALTSQLENARVELRRAQDLLVKGVTAQSRVDAAKLEFDVVTNQLAAAAADKAVIAQSAKEGDVLAPASGRVLTVPMTAGRSPASRPADTICGCPCQNATPPRSSKAAGSRSAGAASVAGTASTRGAPAASPRSTRKSRTAASSPMSRSRASATISSTSARWSRSPSPAAPSSACRRMPCARSTASTTSPSGRTARRSTSPSCSANGSRRTANPWSKC